MPTLDEKITAAQAEFEKAQGQVTYWTSRRDAFVGRLETLHELKAEQSPPKEE